MPMPLVIADKTELITRKYYPEKRSAVRLKRWAARLCSEKRPLWLDLKIAETKNELEAAYKLLHDVYVEKGYMKPHPSEMRISIYNALPHAITFLARDSEVPFPDGKKAIPSKRIKHKTIGTITLVIDSALGLPMEDIYYEEIQSLRRKYLKLAEVSSLAISPEYRYEKMFMYLNQFLVGFALFAGVTNLVIAVNPKHADFYKKVLFFEVIGPERSYSKVQGAPAVAMHLNLKTAENQIKNGYKFDELDACLYTFFFTRTHFIDDNQKEKGEYAKVIMTPEALSYFFIEKTDIFRQAPDFELRHICYYYPKYDFGRIFQKDKTLLNRFNFNCQD